MWLFLYNSMLPITSQQFLSFVTVFHNIIVHNFFFLSKNNNENVLCLSCYSITGNTYPILRRLLLEDLNICFQPHSSVYAKLTKFLLYTRPRPVCWAVNKIGKSLCFHRNYIIIRRYRLMNKIYHKSGGCRGYQENWMRGGYV